MQKMLLEQPFFSSPLPLEFFWSLVRVRWLYSETGIDRHTFAVLVTSQAYSIFPVIKELLHL